MKKDFEVNEEMEIELDEQLIIEKQIDRTFGQEQDETLNLDDIEGSNDNQAKAQQTIKLEKGSQQRFFQTNFKYAIQIL